ncbi:MAG TPA: hypothetical protein VKT29_11405 [Terriglobales bacterium]|nr:hypothetical protein [Terriglobales bacterium]
MPESVMDQIVSELRANAGNYYPQRGTPRNVRVVGHTPKADHYIYDMVIDFADGGERVAAKVYRPNRCGHKGPRSMAQQEHGNLQRVYQAFQKRKLNGVPRPLGDFTEMGAVVAEKFSGFPLQSLIMKAALLPGYADGAMLKAAARNTGEWLRGYHRAVADGAAPLDPASLLSELEKLCERCHGEGLDDASIRTIVAGSRAALARARKALPCSAVLNDFTPLNVIVGEQGVGIADFAKMSPHGISYNDVANFLAAVEALEKYPFCNRTITSQVQSEFLDAYGVSGTELGVLRVLKIRALLSMFAQGRRGKESALRKKVMWATVMKRFIQQAAERSLAPAA